MMFLTLLLVCSVVRLVELSSACYDKVYPLEYAYLSSSVHRTERASANCRPYESGLTTLPRVHTDHYTHCDGTQLKLTDSDLGTQLYNISDHYEWSAKQMGRPLLFTFKTKVNLTTITLHYYSDNGRGLPKLSFYPVPDDFNVWDAPRASYSHVDVAAVQPGGEPAGRRNVSINFNFITKKMLLYKNRNQFTFDVSEVEFSTCIGNNTAETITTVTMAKKLLQHPCQSVKYQLCADSCMNPRESTATTKKRNYTCIKLQSITGTETIHSSSTMLQTTTTQSYTGAHTKEQFTTDTRPTVSITTITLTEKSTANSDTKANSHTASTDIRLVGIGIAVPIVILLLLSAIAVFALVIFLRNSAQRKAGYDDSYSTLCRESVQQMQPQSLHTSNDLYDHIQLSPSTGQAEFISTNETANTNNPSTHQNEYGIHPSVDKDKPKSAKLKITASTISSQDEDKTTSEQPNYAVVNKKKKQKTEKESVYCQSQNTTDQNLAVTEQNVVEERNQPKQSQDGQETATHIPSRTVEPLQELYTAVKKKPKARPANDEEVSPPIPPYTVEDVYTVVQKKPKARQANDEEVSPPIPSYTVEDEYTVVQKKPKANTEENNNATQLLPHPKEELYTAVEKKPKISILADEEEAPPIIPAHTVEELYSAVQKKPKVNTTEDEEITPPVPPHTLD